MKKVLKGSRLRIDEILNNIISKDYNTSCNIEIDGVIYEIKDSKLVPYIIEKEKEI